jgi:hypothetical protein
LLSEFTPDHSHRFYQFLHVVTATGPRPLSSRTSTETWLGSARGIGR